jgi:uncharacterized membrane protein
MPPAAWPSTGRRGVASSRGAAQNLCARYKHLSHSPFEMLHVPAVSYLRGEQPGRAAGRSVVARAVLSGPSMNANGEERPPASVNIASVAELEREYLEKRTPVERIGDAIGAFAGTMWFVMLHICVFTAWFLINTHRVPGIAAFDPYPFILLSMAVSVEAVLLSTFVLMKQNRESRRAEQRGELNLQIDLLSEREATKMLQLLQRICERLGIEEAGRDREVNLLAQETTIKDIAEELKKKLPPH